MCACVTFRWIDAFTLQSDTGHIYLWTWTVNIDKSDVSKKSEMNDVAGNVNVAHVLQEDVVSRQSATSLPSLEPVSRRRTRELTWVVHVGGADLGITE